MSTTLSQPRCHKPNTCGCQVLDGGYKCVRITNARCQDEWYGVEEMDGQEADVRGFSLRKGDGTEYQVFVIEGEQAVCDCPGASYSKDGTCKHGKAIKALIGRGAL